jgi:excisionase family DNA binding protein
MAQHLVTVSELADYLRLSPASMYRALRLGKLPGVKVGLQWRIDLEEFQNRLAMQFDVTKQLSNGSADRVSKRADTGKQPDRKRGRSQASTDHGLKPGRKYIARISGGR